MLPHHPREDPPGTGASGVTPPGKALPCRVEEKLVLITNLPLELRSAVRLTLLEAAKRGETAMECELIRRCIEELKKHGKKPPWRLVLNPMMALDTPGLIYAAKELNVQVKLDKGAEYGQVVIEGSKSEVPP